MISSNESQLIAPEMNNDQEQKTCVIAEVLSSTQRRNGVTSAILRLADKSTVSVTGFEGILAGIIRGNSYTVEYESRVDKSGATSHIVTLVEDHIPEGEAALQRYLSSGVIPGCGYTESKKIVKHFGDSARSVIDESPDLLMEVPGIEESKLSEIVLFIKENRGGNLLQNALARNGFTAQQTKEIASHFKANSRAKAKEAMEKIKSNPYFLGEIADIPLKTLDDLARKVGLGDQSIARSILCINSVLGRIDKGFSGSLGLPRSAVGEICKGEPFYSDIAMTRNAYLHMKETGDLVEVSNPANPLDPFLFKKSVYDQETRVALKLKEKIYYGRSPFQYFSDDMIKEAINNGRVTNHLGREIQMSADQMDAVKVALTNPISIITGGPGTGKTTIVKSVVDAYLANGLTVVGAAPSGKAAERATKAFLGTEMSFSTTHRALVWLPDGGFEFNEENPIEADLVVFDEASMKDSEMMYHSMMAIGEKTTVLFVGDINQLPSVGPGSVLRDLIESGTTPVARLKKIERVVEGSEILKVISAIENGVLPRVAPTRGDLSSAVNFIDVDRPPFEVPEGQDENWVAREALRRTVAYMQKERGYDVDDIQVFLPKNEGAFGCSVANIICQSILNPAGSQIPVMHGKKDDPARYQYRIGDRVMQKKTDRNRGVINGNVGKIVDFEQSTGTLLVKFNDKDELVSYQGAQIYELGPAFAMSVHKGQGSEAKCVITGVMPAHGRSLLQRNLVLTAYSRSSETLVSIHKLKSLGDAIKNTESQNRITLLKLLLQDKTIVPARRPFDTGFGLVTKKMTAAMSM